VTGYNYPVSSMVLRSLSGEILLGIGGIYIFLTAGLLIASAQPHAYVCPTEMSHFECGQYFFNHDEDPAGPYDLTKAREQFELAVFEEPYQNELVWYQLGRIDFLEGDFDAAIDKFQTQLTLHGDSQPQVYYMLGLTYGYKARSYHSRGDWARAEFFFEKFIEYSPMAPWSRVDLAWVLFSQGKYQEMLPILKFGLIIEPDNPWLLNMYGLAIMNTAEDRTMALPHFEKAKQEAVKLTRKDWGMVYPGNDPAEWSLGLIEFMDTIQKNIDLASS